MVHGACCLVLWCSGRVARWHVPRTHVPCCILLAAGFRLPAACCEYPRRRRRRPRARRCTRRRGSSTRSGRPADLGQQRALARFRRGDSIGQGRGGWWEAFQNHQPRIQPGRQCVVAACGAGSDVDDGRTTGGPPSIHLSSRRCVATQTVRPASSSSQDRWHSPSISSISSTRALYKTIIQSTHSVQSIHSGRPVYPHTPRTRRAVHTWRIAD
ncbi:hypothetical protein M433DRAFT_372250 [Acidomyces richmondensis BFW]|nr:MAG: hypothetical protein FE78DRAFT_507113 [Acidomyces sp. 'richmondensis']KYG43130.1 hypothetical protein M433DRAFT_372250 [Acidomyces richmondensis BFW]